MFDLNTARFTYVKEQITKFNVLNKPNVIQLIPKGNPRGSVACWKSHKSTNCRVATEWQDIKTDMRMKPALVEQ